MDSHIPTCGPSHFSLPHSQHILPAPASLRHPDLELPCLAHSTMAFPTEISYANFMSDMTGISVPWKKPSCLLLFMATPGQLFHIHVIDFGGTRVLVLSYPSIPLPTLQCPTYHLLNFTHNFWKILLLFFVTKGSKHWLLSAQMFDTVYYRILGDERKSELNSLDVWNYSTKDISLEEYNIYFKRYIYFWHGFSLIPNILAVGQEIPANFNIGANQ